MKFYIILDTNVIVSALYPTKNNTAVSELMRIIFDENIILLYSKAILHEYRDVLSRKELKIEKSKIGNFINYIKKYGKIVTPNKIKDYFADEEDKKFYEVALNTRGYESRLVTGNIKHFPKKSYVITPSEFIKLYYRYN